MTPDEAAVLAQTVAMLRTTGQHLELILMAAFEQLRTANAIIIKAEAMFTFVSPREPDT